MIYFVPNRSAVVMSKALCHRIIALSFVTLFSMGALADESCLDAFSEPQPYSFAELEQNFLDYSEKYPFAALYSLEWPRFNAGILPQAQESVRFERPAAIRAATLSGWQPEGFSWPLWEIAEVFAYPVYEPSSRRYYNSSRLARLHTGKLVFISPPIKVQKIDGALYSSFNQDIASYQRLTASDVQEFVGVGRTAEGTYHIVRPVFVAASLVGSFHFDYEPNDLQYLYNVISHLEETGLPELHLYFDPLQIRTAADLVPDAFLTGWTDENSLSVTHVGCLSHSMTGSIYSCSKSKMSITFKRERSNEFLFSSADILRARIYAVIAKQFSVQGQLANERGFFSYFIEHDRLLEMFNFLYIWALTDGADSDDQYRAFAIQVNQNTSLAATQWVSEKSLRRHYAKHGSSEFGLKNPEEYLTMAKEFFKSSEVPSVTFKRAASQTTLKYNFNTRELGIVDADGRIITYYLLDEKRRPEGETASYISSQMLR